MEPIDDRKLSRLLREWKVADAPACLDQRVLPPRKPWWSFLLTGSIRVPVPVAAGVFLLLVAMGLWTFRPRTPAPAPGGSTGVTLADFRPLDQPTVRILEAPNESR